MDLRYSEEQSILRETVARFLKAYYPFEHRRKRAASSEPLDQVMWKRFADLGWLGLPFEESAGGFGGGEVEIAILCEEMGRVAVLEPFVQAAVLAGGLIERLGTSSQCELLLAPLIAGRSLPVLAHLEDGARGLLDHVQTRAWPHEAGYVLTGSKVLVQAAPAADVLLVTALLEDEGQIGLFAVPANDEGVILSPYRTVDGGHAADIRLHSANVSKEMRLGATADVLGTLEWAYDRATAALCADAVGAMHSALDVTIAYTKERVQFGKPLASFQALQHRMAEMAVKCEEARASALLATLSVDAPKLLRVRGVSGAKAKIGRVSRTVAQEAIQLHGAMGISEEMPIGTWFKRLYAFENTFGSTADHIHRYAAAAMTPEILESNLLRVSEIA